MAPRRQIKNIGIIPARMASSRFPGKPLVKILGVPMIGHVYNRSLNCPEIGGLYIATCDPEIADYAAQIGAKCIMTGSHHERASERTAEAYQKIVAAEGLEADVVVMIQGDEPMIQTGMLQKVVEPFADDASVQVSCLMAPIRSDAEFESPDTVKVVTDLHDNAIYFSREPIPSRKKGARDFARFKQLGLMAFRSPYLMRYIQMAPTPLEIAESVDMMRILENGDNVRMIPVEWPSLSVDRPEDVAPVEQALSAATAEVSRG